MDWRSEWLSCISLPEHFSVETIKQKISVSFEYTVAFTRNVFSPENSTILNILREDVADKPRRLLFVIEKNLIEKSPELKNKIKKYCQLNQDLMQPSSTPEIISGGEGLKSQKAMSGLCELFNKNALCRHSYVCIVGGGAFLDAIGFAASIVHRGIRQIRFPTTVLAQNDSGVGVKTAINMYDKKNYLGTFAPPFAVINDLDFLETLSDRDWVAGIPEAFKVAIIKDAEFFRWLCGNVSGLASRDEALMEHLIKRCAELHLEHIRTSGDPFEFGSARPLDFGHWSAHKLEILANGELRHGEAVAIGLLLDTFYAAQKGLIGKDILDDLQTAFITLKLPIWNDVMLPDASGTYSLIEGIEEFREHLGGELHITLPDGLGNKIEVSELDEDIIKEGIAFLSSLRSPNADSKIRV
jgi:3-dehydroquinate synthase